ncbi:MAG TPA: MFS transporter [Thermoplasmata archaeon]|nr:MFS transporter [Thermoplasmata archaeon]
MSVNGSANGRVNNPTFLLVLLSSIAIMIMYVEAMAFPSLPIVMADFSLTPEDYSLASWIITIYLVVGAVAIPIFGKLGDIYGKKKMLLIAMTIYTVAVTLTGFSRDVSDSIYVMIGFRAVQGLGMSMFPLAFSLIRDEFPMDKIAIAQGVVSAMFGVGTAVGFLLGGYVTDTFGWQWTYHTVVPFVVFATLLVAFKVKESPVRLKVKIDYIGAALLALTLVSFLVGITETRDRGWADPLIVGLLILSMASLLSFAYWQTKAKEPLVRPSLLKERNIALTNAIGFMIGFALFTVSQTIAALAGFNFGLDATHIGFLNLPTSILTLILGPTVGLLVRKHGPKWPMTFGMVMSIAGFISLYFNHATELEVMIGITIMGSGTAFAMVGSINMIVISTPREETGISTAMTMIVRTSGSVAGPAVAAVIISDHSSYVAGIGVVPDDSAYQIIFLMSSVFMGIGVLLALLLKNRKALPEEGPRMPGAPSGK